MADKHIEFKVEPIEGHLIENFTESNLHFYRDGFIKITPSNSCMPAPYKDYIDTIRRFNVRPDDVWIVTFPKCGTTWSQEMVWLLINDLDYETARKVHLVKRSPFLEISCLFSKTGEHYEHHKDALKMTENLESPRLIKSHLPLQLLPEQLWTVKPKIIYVTREAKDAALSYYHHHKLMSGYNSNLDDFVDAFVSGLAMPGSIWDHVLDFWNIRHEPNILFNTFEEMKKDLPGVVTKTAKFLDRKLNDEQLKHLCEHLSFESMKKNPAVNLEEELLIMRNGEALKAGEAFLRKGKVGGWKSELSPEAADKIDKWTRECLDGTDYPISK